MAQTIMNTEGGINKPSTELPAMQPVAKPRL
jgi:hypothetical protein